MNPINAINSVLCIYSKYSESSKYLIQFIPNITKLCIDNPDVKKSILDSNIKIQRVPCIIIVYNNGMVDTFEGTRALEWVNQNVFPLPIFNPPLPQPQQQVATFTHIDPPNPTPQALQNQHQQIQQQQYQAGGTPIDMISQESESQTQIDESVKKEKKGESVKSRAEELERDRNALLFTKDPKPLGGSIGGMGAMGAMGGGVKPGGPINENVTTGVRQL